MKETYYFTFGSGQLNENCFVKVMGDYGEARKEMFKRYQDKWAFQYSEKQWINDDGKTQQEVFNLREIK